MGYEQYRDAIGRTVTWRVALRLDYCTRTCGQSPCAAAGPPWCYYTYSTCLDPAHYSRGTKEYAFSLACGATVVDALPYLAEIKHVPTEIVPKESVTRRARITLDFIDDAPLALANPDKSVGNAETGGSFLRNLIVRNPNAIGREAEIRQGFPELAPEDYRPVFKGVIDKMECSVGKAQVVIKDMLKLLDNKVPPKQSSKNVLLAGYSGGATMAVADASEFQAPGTVKIDDEYITFTGMSNGNLSGCTPGRYGSAAAGHSAGRPVRQVVVLAEPADGGGLPADEIFLTLLCTHGGLDPLGMALADRGAKLIGAINASASALAVSSSEAFAETGVIRIDDELIGYRGLLGTTLTLVERGAYGTTAAAHSDQAPVLITRLSEELGRWWSGTLWRRFVENQAAVKDLVNDLRDQCLVHVWQAEDSTIAAKAVAPPFFTDPPQCLDDETGLIDAAGAWDLGSELRVSRVVVYYDPLQPEAGNNPDAYAGVLVLVDAEAESADSYGEVRAKEIFASYIFREHEALLLASRYLIRYRNGAATFKFALELKDDRLAVGDFVRIDSSDVIAADGAPQSRALYEVLKKQRVSDNKIEFTAIDTRLDRRYPVIAPTDFTADYDAAGEDDRERYGWAGDEGNQVGSTNADGYYIY
jgi:hypothetical protein